MEDYSDNLYRITRHNLTMITHSSESWNGVEFFVEA